MDTRWEACGQKDRACAGLSHAAAEPDRTPWGGGGEDALRVSELAPPISQTLMGVPDATLEDIRTVCFHAQYRRRGQPRGRAWRQGHCRRGQAVFVATCEAS